MSHYLHAQKTGPDSHLGTSSCCCACTLVDLNDVGFSYCLLYKHGAGDGVEGERWGNVGGGGVPCQPYSASAENCEARLLTQTLLWCGDPLLRGHTFITIAPAAPAHTVDAI